MKIKELEEQIKAAQDAYYNGQEILSDDEYDALVYELSLLDPDNEVLKVIGAEVTSNEWSKIKHLSPLGSLNKVNAPDEMSEWIAKTLQNKPVIVVEKLDGLSLGAQYKNGKLVAAALRGNGLEGENILQNVLKMKGCVKQIDKSFSGTVRGEIILKKSDHLEHFPDYSNPRNAASGLSRKSEGDSAQHLTLMMYDVMGDVEFETEEDKFKFLEKNKFIVPNYKVCKNACEVNELWQKYQDKIRESLDYEIDGLVISCDDLKFQESLGETNLRKKGKIAFKFANQFLKTTVKEITIQTGKSGRLTPVCWFDEINLLGSKVKKASVYNIAYIDKLGLDVGAEVLVTKAGEIIPRVEKVIKSTGSTFKVKPICEECGSKAEMIGENLVCPNSTSCPAQVEGRLIAWVKDLTILEWGDGLINKLVTSGKATTIADLYRLSIEDLSSLDRMGEKSAQKAYDLLWKDTCIPLDIFLGGLSMTMIGSSSIRMLMAAGYDTLEKIQAMKASDFEKVNGVGPIKAKILEKELKQNKQLIDDILSTGVTIKGKVMGKLTGKKFCFTGPAELKRAVLEKIVTDGGGEVTSSCGKSTTHLVIADPSSNSTKAVKARELGVTLISEQEFLEMADWTG